jgi:hypothetical protein
VLDLHSLAAHPTQRLWLQRHRMPDDEKPLAAPHAHGDTLPGFVSAGDRASIPAASQPVEGESEADRKKREKREKKVQHLEVHVSATLNGLSACFTLLQSRQPSTAGCSKHDAQQ